MNNKIAKYISTFLLLAAASLPCATIAQGSSRTVRIAAVNSEDGMVTSVDLAVSAGADAIALYAVHGAADHGADIAAWDAVDPVCDVPAGEGEQIVNYSISRPYDAFYRFLLASVDGAPFKKQLAFLKSTGSQYFILGDKCPNQNWRVVADVKFTTLDSTVGFWGARKAARDSAFLCLCESGSKLRFDMADALPIYTGTSGRRYQIDETNQGVSIAWDGGSDNVPVSTGTFTSPCQMALFAVNSNGSATALTPGKMTVYSFKVCTNRTDVASLIYDLVPCVKNDDTVTFYNRVDESFLSPVGTFTYDEADVVPATVGDWTVASLTEALWANKRITSSSIARRNGVLTAKVAVTAGLETNTVIVAYGSADGGDNPAHWENCAILGSVAFDATLFSAAVPFEWSQAVRYARLFLVSQIDSLGDKVLKSSGTQYVVTDYTANSLTKIEARLAFIDTTSKTIVMWSGRESPGARTFTMLIDDNNGQKIRFDYKNVTSRPFTPPAAGMDLHTVSMGGASCSLDGATKEMNTTVTDFTAGAPLTFFAMNTSGTITYTSRVAFAEVKVWSNYEDDSSLVLHLKPAVENGLCGFRNILDGGNFYPNRAESGEDFEVLYQNLRVHSVSDVKSRGEQGLTIFVW